MEGGERCAERDNKNKAAVHALRRPSRATASRLRVHEVKKAHIPMDQIARRHWLLAGPVFGEGSRSDHGGTQACRTRYSLNKREILAGRNEQWRSKGSRSQGVRAAARGA